MRNYSLLNSIPKGSQLSQQNSLLIKPSLLVKALYRCFCLVSLTLNCYHIKLKTNGNLQYHKQLLIGVYYTLSNVQKKLSQFVFNTNSYIESYQQISFCIKLDILVPTNAPFANHAQKLFNIFSMSAPSLQIYGHI